MAETKKVQEETVVMQDDSARVINRAKGVWEQNKKLILIGGGALILLVGGFFGYKKFISEPANEKANEAIWKAQQYLDKDSIKLALNGDGQNAGFEKIAKNYSGTKAGKLANYYTGLCYLKLSDFNKAVTYLKDYSGDSKPIQALAYRLLGDAYSELNKNDDAIDYYDKAGHYFSEDEGQSSESLFRAGLKSEVVGKNDNAIKYYKEIKEKFPKSERGYQIDKYLARLGSVE
ncbi:MAG: tetratricopeptide repeat protein [Chitinophagaceae bacterium]